MQRKPTTSRALDPAVNKPTVEKFDLPSRAGMPALDSVIEIKLLVAPAGPSPAVAPKTPTFRIITTNEVDGYESLATSQGDLVAALAKSPTPSGDKFQGTDRKAAKLSIAKKKIEKFSDLKDLINSLTVEADMVNHNPPITRSSTSNRVAEENRNVHVTAFLYAASREKDNDFHLIIGRDPKKSPELYMTMEISGLPPSSSDSFKKLKTARDAYKNFFDGNLPGISYDFYDPPIPVEIEGSLFFDVTHSSGQRPGPKSLKSRMPVIWEVHPVTSILFES